MLATLSSIPAIIIMVMAVTLIIIMWIYRFRVNSLKSEILELLEKNEKLRFTNSQMEDAIAAQKKFRKKEMQLQEDLGLAIAANKKALGLAREKNSQKPIIDRLNSIYFEMWDNSRKNL